MFTEAEHTCPYFNGRPATRQPSLKQCSQYKENSCCTNTEIDVLFSQVTFFRDMSEFCRQHMTHIACYVCSPYQRDIFNGKTLQVCEYFCNEVLTACANAMYKGRRLKSLYKNGVSFCQDHGYDIVRTQNRTQKTVEKRCLGFDFNLKNANERIKTNMSILLFVLLRIFM